MAGSQIPKTDDARDPNEGDQVDPTGQQPDAFDPNDPDAQELAEALAAVKAEQTEGGEPDEGNQGEPSADNTGKADAKGAGQKGEGEPEPKGDEPQQPTPMIPKQRFDEVLSRQAEIERQNAFLQGQLMALRNRDPSAGQGQQGQQTQQQRQPTLEEVQAEIRKQQDDIAAKFDDGTLTYSEMQKQMRDLNDREYQIREQQLLQKVPKPQPQQQPQPQPQQTGDSLYLDQLTAQLEQEHPYVGMIENDSDFNWLVGKAREQLEQQGVRLDNSDTAKYQLRKQVAVLSDQYGPMLTGKQLPAKEQKPSGPSDAAQARLNKMQMRQDMPPDLSRIPSQGGANQAGEPGELSDSQIEAMSDDEIAALPASTQNRMLGISS